eukprot:COSAG02_NODE_61825_length_267_cov_0.928571_1_plen_42_part_01
MYDLKERTGQENIYTAPHFFNDPTTIEIYTLAYPLSLDDPLP